MSCSDMQWKIHDLFRDVFLPYSINSYSCSSINADPSNAEWLENHYEDFPKAKTHYEDFSKAKTHYEDFSKAKTHAKHQFEASFADAGVPAVAGALAPINMNASNALMSICNAQNNSFVGWRGFTGKLCEGKDNNRI